MKVLCEGYSNIGMMTVFQKEISERFGLSIQLQKWVDASVKVNYRDRGRTKLKVLN